MAGDTANPRIWAGADVRVAPVGTTAPTNTATAWSATWLAAGLLSEDGISESRDVDSNDHYAYGGILVRTSRSKHKRSLKVTFLEDNKTVFGLINPGSSAAIATGIVTRTVKVPVTDVRAFGLELVDGSIIKRRVIPRGEIVEVGEIKFDDSDLVGFEATINVYPASDGTYYIDITNDPQADPT